MNQQLDWRRLGLLIRNDFLNGLRRFLIAFLVIGIIAILNAIPSAGFGAMQEGFYDRWFVGMMIIWGTIHASLQFNELGDKRLNEGYLLLPASTLEKTVARYLNSTVVFTTYLLVFMTLLPLLLEGINMVLFGRNNGLFNPFSGFTWRIIGIFMLIQPVFFLGGAWFRRNRWFKTVISIFIICALLGLIGCLVFFILFSGDMGGFFQGNGFTIKDGLNWQVNDELFAGIVIGLKVLCFAIAPPFCLYLAWLRVQETQASHGI